MVEKVFVDTNPLIYLVSEQRPYYDGVVRFMTDCINADRELYTSTITDAEFLIKPFSDNDWKQIDRYRFYLNRLGFLKCFITEQVAEESARLRSKYTGIKLADALQLAACLDCNCNMFFTNDKQLRQITEVNVLYLGDFMSA